MRWSQEINNDYDIINNNYDIINNNYEIIKMQHYPRLGMEPPGYIIKKMVLEL